MNLKTAIIDTHTHFGIDRNKIFEKNTGVKKKRGQLLLCFGCYRLFTD